MTLEGLIEYEDGPDAQEPAVEAPVTPEAIDAVGEAQQAGTDVATEHDVVDAAEAEQAEIDADAALSKISTDIVATTSTALAASVSGLPGSLAAGIASRRIAENAISLGQGDFTLREIAQYNEFRSTLLNNDSETDLDALGAEIQASGLDELATEELMAGVQRLEAGEDIGEIKEGHVIDNEIDGPVEETEDIEEYLRDLVESGVEFATEATGLAVDLAQEIVRGMQTGHFDFDAIILGFRDLLSVNDPEEEEELEDVMEENSENVKVNNDTKLTDILVGLPEDADVVFTKPDDDSQSIILDLRDVDNRGDLPDDIRVRIPNSAVYEAFVGNNGADTIDTSEPMFTDLPADGMAIRLETQTIDGSWGALNNSFIVDDVEYEASAADTEEPVEDEQA